MKTAFCSGAILVWAFVAHGTTAFYFSSSPTSWVGQGQTRTITPADGHRFIPQLLGTALMVSIDVPNQSDFWYLEVQAADFAPLSVGLYSNVQDWPFQQPGHPGLKFEGNGAGPSGVTGWFDVLEYSEVDGTVTSVAVDFAQYEYGNLADWCIGSLRYNSDIPLTVPEPAMISLVLLGSLMLLRVRHSDLMCRKA